MTSPGFDHRRICRSRTLAGAIGARGACAGLWLFFVLVLCPATGVAQAGRSAGGGDLEAEEVTAAAPRSHGEQGAAVRAAPRDTALSVRVFGGWRWLRGGDVNTGVAETMRQDLSFRLGERVTLPEVVREVGGGVPALLRGTEMGADVIVDLTPRWGLVGGVGWIESLSEGMITTPPRTYRWPSRTSMTLELGAVPVRFGVQYAYPVGRRVRLLAAGGPTLYLTRLRWSNRFEVDTARWMRLFGVDPGILTKREVFNDTRGYGFGMHGGLWVDVSLSARFGLLVGVEGTLANIGGLEGTVETRHTGSDEQFDGIEKGTLRLLQFGDPPRYSWMLVGDRSATYRGISPTDVRDARLGLGGLRLSSGVRIRF